MLIDATNHDNDIATDICIIGSGVGGGTLVAELSKLNVDFVVIEAGNLKGSSPSVQAEHVGRDFGVRSTRSIQIGGTSNLWHGVLSPLDEIDFIQRDWIPYSGWPISLKELLPYYQQASKLLRVENFEYFQKAGLPDYLLEKLEDIEFSGDYLTNKLFQQPLPPTNFKDIVVAALANNENQHCYYNAVALELISTENGAAVKTVKVGTAVENSFVVSAKQFIIASGALETPRLLLNSNDVQKQGLGNQQNLVGRFLMDHPMGNLCQLQFLTPKKAPIYSDLKYSDVMKIKSGLEMTAQAQQKLALPNHNFYLRPSFIQGIDDKSEKVKLSLLALKDGGVSFSDIWQVLTHLNVIRQIITYKLSLNVTFKFADLFFVTEQIPNPNSTVSLSARKDHFGYPIAKVDWQVLPEDIESMRHWYDLLLTQIFPVQHFKFTHTQTDFDWENIYTSAIHHVGTARMGDNEKQGVIDKNLKVFGVDNVYICDGSIFTTAGNVNNSFTIAAFACRLSKYLQNQA